MTQPNYDEFCELGHNSNRLTISSGFELPPNFNETQQSVWAVHPLTILVVLSVLSLLPRERIKNDEFISEDVQPENRKARVESEGGCERTIFSFCNFTMDILISSI